MFWRSEVPYYVVPRRGITPDPMKVDKVKNYPAPTNSSKVRQFLGLGSYYRRFIKDFSKVASPLYSLISKDRPFQGTLVCQNPFDTLKQQPPFLRTPSLVTTLCYRLMLVMRALVQFYPKSWMIAIYILLLMLPESYEQQRTIMLLQSSKH